MPARDDRCGASPWLSHRFLRSDDACHGLSGPLVLGREAPRAPDPPGFRRSLWPPQATLLAHMLEVEAFPFLAYAAGARGPEDPFVEVSVARVSERFSFGKTTLCAALIQASAAPPPRRVTRFFHDERDFEKSDKQITVRPRARNWAPSYVLDYKEELPATLVIAAGAVLRQWEETLADAAPALRVFTVDGVRPLRALARHFSPDSGGPFPYGVVLLKAGGVTGKYRDPGAGAEPVPLTAALNDLAAGCAWRRLIVDDFDTITIAAAREVLPPANFTWLISATRRKSSQNVLAPLDADPLGLPAGLPAYCPAINGPLCFHCEEKYVEDFISSTTLSFRRIVVPAQAAAGRLRALGIPAEVVEVASAGAAATAAQMLNISASSLNELVMKVLRREVEKLRDSHGTLAWVHPALAALEAGDSAAARRAAAASGRVKNCGEIEDKALHARLAAIRTHAEAARDRSSLALDRLKDNVREEMCLVCGLPFDEVEEGSGAYVTACCQITLCHDCVFEQGRRRYIPRCPNCLQGVDPASDLIFVGADVPLVGVLEADAGAICSDGREGGGSGGAGGGAPPPADPFAFCKDDPRLRALLQLICAAPVECLSDAPCPPLAAGLLAGKNEVPHPPGAPHRYLVFVAHAESAVTITGGLGRVGVGHAAVRGTRAQKDAAVARFKAGEVPVLLAASSKDCSGLHLPEVTRLVFYHHHRDEAQRCQSIGRGQRVGRTTSLEVVQILDEYETRR